MSNSSVSYHLHNVIIRPISGDKENCKRKLLPELLALMFTRHCVCHGSIQSTELHIYMR